MKRTDELQTPQLQHRNVLVYVRLLRISTYLHRSYTIPTKPWRSFSKHPRERTSRRNVRRRGQAGGHSLAMSARQQDTCAVRQRGSALIRQLAGGDSVHYSVQSTTKARPKAALLGTKSRLRRTNRPTDLFLHHFLPPFHLSSKQREPQDQS